MFANLHIDESFSPTNPDHTGWPHPGLYYAGILTSNEVGSALSKHIYYQLFASRTFPFRGLKRLEPPKGWSRDTKFIVPAQLHRAEGREACVWRLRNFIAYVRHPHDIHYGPPRNLHIYTAENDQELPADVSMEEILQGKYGVMSKEHPLRIVHIPGKKGASPVQFPGSKCTSLKSCPVAAGDTYDRPPPKPSSTTSGVSNDRAAQMVYSDSRLPTYEEATETCGYRQYGRQGRE
jgi:hypothetical protein